MRISPPLAGAPGGLFVLHAFAASGAQPLKFGFDRSKMGTQWTLSPPEEPDISPFLGSEYDKPGDFGARRVAVLEGLGGRTRNGSTMGSARALPTSSWTW